MNQKWEQIWNKKSGNMDVFEALSFEDKVLYLKELNGFDSVEDGKELNFSAFFKQYSRTKSRLSLPMGGAQNRELQSVYEVGCGSGANLYLFERDGVQTGGIDYSKTLVEVAGSVLASKDLQCGEATNIPIEPQYDSILSNSVFSYFPDYAYAESVLERMLQKCRYSIGILDVHDENKKQDFIRFRRSRVENYDEKYKGLEKLFYPKAFFVSFAEKHGLDVLFSHSDLDHYWNNEFIFNCFFYKTEIPSQM